MRAGHRGDLQLGLQPERYVIAASAGNRGLTSAFQPAGGDRERLTTPIVTK
jgi:hypothetical protein